MIKVYDKNEQRFVTNGLIVLDSCKSLFITEELNGSYELEMEYPIDSRGKWQYLAQDNIIEADGQLFRIYHTDKKDFNTIAVNARHIFYDLLDNLVEDVDIRGLSGVAALEKVMSNLAYVTGFTWMSDIVETNNIYLDDESGDITGKNPVDALMFLVNTYSGELLRDNFNIKMLKARGQDRGMLISYGKNIKGISEDLNIDAVVTRIKPIGQDGLYLPEEFVDSPHIGDYAHPKISVVEFSDVNDYDGLRKAAKDHFTNDKCDIPQVNYKVDFVELRKTEEYKDYAVLESVYLGDTVTVKVKKLNIDIKCKVIKIKKNVLTDRIEEIELGNFKKNIAESINKAAAVTDVFGGAIVNNKLTKSFLQSWVDNATDLIIKNNGGHVLMDENGMSIMDTTDKATAKNVWRFNLGGIGFSNTGYNGTFGTAMTQDGRIVADYITAGELSGAILKSGSVKTSALELNAQQIINTTVPSLVADNSVNKSNIVSLQTTVNAIPGQIDSKVSASATTTLSSAKTYTDNQVSPVSSIANNAQTAASNAQISANNAKNAADIANATANDLKNNVIPPLANRLTSAEQKITPDAIVDTVTDSTTYYKDTLLPKVVDLTVSRAGPVINPLQAYNFTGGIAVVNNVLVTMPSGQNEYTPLLDGLEIYGVEAVTFDKQVDRVQDAEADIIQHAKDISLVVKDHAVDGTSLVSAINMSGAKIDMSALNINLSGYVTFNSLSTAGQTVIDGGNIKTDSITVDKLYGTVISGKLLRTSNTSNYMMLHEQYLEVFNGSSKIMALGYFTNTGGDTPGTYPSLWMHGGSIVDTGTDFEINSSKQISISGYNVGIDGYNGLASIGLIYDGKIEISGNSLTYNGNSLATQSYVSSAISGYATQSFVTSQGYQTASQVQALINAAIQNLLALGVQDGSFKSADGKTVDVYKGIIDSIY